jgi:hypothetical protein
MTRPYSAVRRLRSRKSTAKSLTLDNTPRAVEHSRYVFDISPGHVWSLRAAAQISSTRDLPAGSWKRSRNLHVALSLADLGH